MAAKKKTVSKKKPAPKKKFVAKPAAKKKAAPAKKSAAKSSKPAKAGKSAKKSLKAKRPVRTAKRPSPRRKVPVKKATKVVKPQRPSAPTAPEAFALAKLIAGVASDKKAEGILVLDMARHSSAVGYDYLVLATGESDRQLTAIQEGVDDLLKPQGKRPASVEASADWVCVTWDEGVVAHFFTADRRDQMDLEGLWKDAPRVTL
ncbi:MAG TPA: ribosome silencing factor [Archangium sp.]